MLEIGKFIDGVHFDLLSEGFATKHIQWLAKTRVGKTYGASKTLEQMSKANIPWVTLDPVRAYWGLKTGFDNIVIFGDPDWKRTEMPLVEHPHDNLKLQAELIADLLVSDQKINAIIDMNEWSKSSMHVFGTAFFWRLYSKNKSFQRMVVTEEADIFAPQQVRFPDEIACLDAYSNLVRRGASRGLGTMTISQRPALVQKDVLSQSEITFQLRVTSKADVDAFKGLIEGDYEFLSKKEKELPRSKRDAALAEKLDNILSEVKNADVGEAFVYSPELDLRMWVKIGKKDTYHAGATLGEGDYKSDDDRVSVKPVDLAQVKAKLQVFMKETEKKTEKIKKRMGLTETPTGEAQKQIEALNADRLSQLRELEKKDKEIEDLKVNLQAALDESNSAEYFHNALRKFLHMEDLDVLRAEHQTMMGEGSDAVRELKLDGEQAKVTIEKKVVTKPAFKEGSPEWILVDLITDGLLNTVHSVKDIYRIIIEKYSIDKNYPRYYKNSLWPAMSTLSHYPYNYLEKDGILWKTSEIGRKYTSKKMVAT